MGFHVCACVCSCVCLCVFVCERRRVCEWMGEKVGRHVGKVDIGKNGIEMVGIAQIADRSG